MAAPPPKKAKTANPDPQVIEQGILDYMRTQNRPYSLLNVYDNMHAQFPKAHMQCALERLVAEGKLVMKEYGAQKFFFCPQSSFGDCSNAASAGIEQEISELKGILAELNTRIAALLADCPISDEQLQAARSAATDAMELIRSDILRIQRRINDNAARGDVVAAYDTAISKFGKVFDEGKKRKKISANFSRLSLSS